MKIVCFFTYLFYFSIHCLAQKPMQVHFIESKLDSILNEADLLYEIEKSKITAKKCIKNDLKQKIELKELITYKKNDTVNVIGLNHVGLCFLKLSFYKDYETPIRKNLIVRKLTQFEDSVKQHHHLLISKINKKFPEIDLSDEFSYSFAVIPGEEEIKVFKLTLTNSTDNIPFGNDFLYSFNFKNELIYSLSYYDFKPKYIKSKTELLILVYQPPIPFIFPSDICKFKLFHNQDINKFSAYSRRNKQYFTYSLKNNSLIVHR